MKTGPSQTKTGRLQMKTGRLQMKTGRLQTKTGLLQMKTGRLQMKTGRLQMKTGPLQTKTGRLQMKTGRLQIISRVRIASFGIWAEAVGVIWSSLSRVFQFIPRGYAGSSAAPRGPCPLHGSFVAPTASAPPRGITWRSR